MASKPKRSLTKFWKVAVVTWLLLGVSVVALMVSVADCFSTSEVPYLTTTLVIIFGTTTLLSCLVVAAVMFRVLGLADAGEALGLPSGSVRALIALILIIIFAIMVIFMHADMTISPLTYENGTYVTAQDGSIIYENPPLDAQIDFSKQLLTTISTLIVAVAGFYFGTKSVKVAQAAEEKPVLVINPSGSAKLVVGETLTIKVETSPRNEKVNWKIDDPTKGSIVLEDDEYKFKPSDQAKEGTVIKLTCTLAKHSNISKQLEITMIKKAGD